jgi:hypothetical protein
MKHPGTLLLAMVSSVLTACGVGGGPGSESPAAVLTSSHTTALVNEPVTLIWSSTQSTTCQISGVAGSLAPSGSTTVSFAQAAMQTFTLMCSQGSSQSATASVSLHVMPVSTFTVPTDLDQVQYPDSYTRPTTRFADLSNDPCKLDYNMLSYPQSWIGSYPLPEVRGAPLNPSIVRGMYLKDIMLSDNPSFNPGCTGSLKAQFDRTIARLKKLNIDVAYIPQWHWIGIKPDGSWYIMRAEDSFGPLSDSDLRYFVSAAHKAGIKVLMNNQIQGLMLNNNASVPAASPENFTKWFAAYTEFIRERAPFFQSIGIDIWELGCNACIYQDWGRNTPEDHHYFAEQYARILPIMKSAYKGRISMFANSWLSDRPEMLEQIDVIVSGAWDGGFAPSAQTPYNVQNYKQALLANALSEGALKSWDRPGKTLMLSMGVQSRANWFTLPGYVEETGCTSSVNELNISSSSCIQRQTQPDFSIQAIYYEAFFRALASRTFKGQVIVAPGDMWETDSLVSDAVFPNIGATIRNKPAEGLIKAWFAR